MAVSSSTAFAQPVPPGEGWRKAFTSPQGSQRELYTHWVRVVDRRGSVVTFEELTTGEFGYIEQYDFKSVQIGQANCATSDLRRLRTRRYPDHTAQWAAVIPGTNADLLFETVCR